MENNITYTQFFNQFIESINDNTFAKLTFAKTIGNTESNMDMKKSFQITRLTKPFYC